MGAGEGDEGAEPGYLQGERGRHQRVRARLRAQRVGWGAAEGRPGGAGESAKVGEAEADRDLGDRGLAWLRRLKSLMGGLQSQLHEELPDRHAAASLEFPAQ